MSKYLILKMKNEINNHRSRSLQINQDASYAVVFLGVLKKNNFFFNFFEKIVRRKYLIVKINNKINNNER